MKLELNNKRKIQQLSEFEKIWTGVVLINEEEKQIFSKKFNFKFLSNYILPVLSSLLFLFIFENAINTTVLNAGLFLGELISLLAGLSVSLLLIIQSLGKSNHFINQLCGADAKHNCNDILSSKAANITSWLTLSDLGFLYFSGSLVLLLFSKNAIAVSIVVGFNLLMLPFTFWSVYYQWRIANTWCRLCLMIQGLFWVQAIFSIYIFLQNPELFTGFYPSQILLYAILYIFSLVLWLNIKPYIKDLQQISPLKRELNQFKFNVEAFKNLLIDQKQYICALPKTSIVLGNPNASLEITMVSNPFCNPCAKAHQFLDEWLKKGMDVRLNIIYTFSMSAENQQKQFFEHLIALKEDAKYSIDEILQDWYSEDYQQLAHWKEKYPATQNENNKVELLEQFNWCKLNEIKGTPTFYVNGYQLPENYRIKDLKYVLMNLYSHE
jgi:hypothetical protein